MEKINAIIIDGKVYEIVETDELSCNGCVLSGKCKDIYLPCADYLLPKGRMAIYRFSQELTDKLNDK